ncbi:MAG TPA: hypothetical protein ENI20_06975 [Bacteroides sp.]|nr:hypothetical protein [Bacteroides sp.]
MKKMSTVELQESYEKLNKKSAVGIDGKTWQQYGPEFPERRDSLLAEFKSGRYRAPAIRRGYISKDKHSQRPLGIATMEDKVLQASVRKVIEPIYEVFVSLENHTTISFQKHTTLMQG